MLYADELIQKDVFQPEFAGKIENIPFDIKHIHLAKNFEI